MKPIVIVTQMRSGSNLLGEYLSQLPGAILLGETFKTGNPSGFDRVLRKIDIGQDAVAELEKLRSKDRAAFWPVLLDLLAAHNKRAVAKIFYGAAERGDPLWDALTDAAILHLIRENPLASVVSLELAERAANWQTKEYRPDHEAEPIEIRKRKCINHIERLTANIEWARARYCGGDYFELSYDIVARRPKIARVLGKALGEAVRLKRPKHVQQRMRPLAEIVSNYAEVAEFDRNYPLLLDKFRRPFRD
jgi:LPS sulfotransferase NodH